MYWQDEEIFVTVKAYPEPSRKYSETSCVAGVTSTNRPVRLFPIPARSLESDHDFRKYSVIRARIRKATDDVRPESHKVDFDSIRQISRIETSDGWKERNLRVEAFRVADSVDQLRLMFDEGKASNTPSLALIRPKEILSLDIEPRDRSEWNSKDLASLLSPSLFSERPKVPLEFIPYRFKYRFFCNDPRCAKPHHFSVLDWEMNHTYRCWKRAYGESGWKEKFLQIALILY